MIRLINRDGSFNVIRQGRRFRVTDLYHSLLVLQWRSFFALLAAGWIAVNLLFALGYLACGPGALAGTSDSPGGHFADCFFFSVHTLATIGYGNLTPHGLGANLLVVFEALVGLMGLALGTGLLFARFSRPTARVIFSDRAIIAAHDGIPSLLFRIANARLNQIAEAQIDVVLVRDELTAEGVSYRTFSDLVLERGRSPIFALTWLIVHPITRESPLHGLDAAALRAMNAEFIVTLTGVDDTFSQPIHARYSYTVDELVWDRDFADMLHRQPDGKIEVHLEKIHHLKEEGAHA